MSIGGVGPTGGGAAAAAAHSASQAKETAVPQQTPLAAELPKGHASQADSPTTHPDPNIGNQVNTVA
ncbi:MAG: hypothetical protein ACI93R_004185 [Flavobacteriales bacterium]|jgi:hypothetical protein